jgi:hypothetical protein
MVSTSHMMTKIDKKKKADLMSRIREHERQVQDFSEADLRTRIKEHDRRIQKLTKMMCTQQALIDEIASQMKP